MASRRKGSSHNCKIVLLGEGCVGKTSLVLRYVEDTFSDKHITTLQASFLNKRLNVKGKRANLSIWDTAGQERFHALGPIYYRDANGAVLVYDISDPDSFQKVKVWVKELRKMLGEDICLAIAGNKSDLEHQRQIDIQTAESYAQSVGAQHFQTSAKLNQGIDELFLELSQKMISTMEEKSSSRTCRVASETGTSAITVMDQTREALDVRRKSKCCGGGDEVLTGIPVDNSAGITGIPGER